ncbi:MAG: UDP-N-acetylglucosamine--N-acetylmuramyl-(pentapeptide) pyrophosphoryl-undecaprenol N-acetylglucosamine transferase [Planctomycetes bacterium]|nr:UDP-N-acetylglucosamine--N-acetylmuramyl-(pentapeptide) pyrophosphoryl-undecaprenol N-acetylglucosamine transferase [Planctomycetota bacterium]
MRVAFIGGGTGGHLTPAIGIAEGMIARGHQVEFWLSGRQVELDYVNDNLPHKSLNIDNSRLPRHLAALKAFPTVRKYCQDFDPQVLVSLGGYAGATALAARRRPIVCLEGNVVVGKSVRVVSRFAKRTLVMFNETAKSLPRATIVGPISRAAVVQPSREQAYAKFKLKPDVKTLLVMGGSQGAVALNNCVLDMLPQIQKSGWQLLCLTGTGKHHALQQAVDDLGVAATILENCNDMGSAYACADLMLSRGGASTLAEVWLNQLPTLVMPYKHHDMQQQRNAEQLSPGVLLFDGSHASRTELLDIMACDQRRSDMRMALAESLVGDGTQIACDCLEEIGGRKS